MRVYMTVLRLHHYCFGWPQLIHKCCKLLVPLPPTQSETLRALPQELERYRKSDKSQCRTDFSITERLLTHRPQLPRPEPGVAEGQAPA